MFYFLDLRKVLKIVIPLSALTLLFYAGASVFNSRFPLKYFDIIERYAQVHGVDPVLVSSIINVESRFNRYAVSPVGASGLMQIMEPTAVWAAEKMGIENFVYSEMIFDPEININIGTWYINRLINQYGELPVALAAYNAGSGNVTSWLNDPELSEDGVTLSYIPFGETRRYVKRVDINMKIYAFLLRGK